MKLNDITSVITDYVANGSFKSLRDNAYYVSKDKGFARVIRLTDYNNSFNENDTVWVDESGYNFLSKSSLKPKDIIISNVGAYLGTVFYAPNLTIPMTLGPNAILIRPNEKVLNEYLYYLLSSHYGFSKIMAIKSGSAMPKFNKTDLKAIEFFIHNKDEQQHIVDILGTLDEKIENNEQLINILENLAEKKYLDFAIKTSTKTRLEDVIELFDSKRIPLSSREREQRKGIYPYYGATGILDYVNSFLFSGEYVLFAEDGTVTDTNGHPIVQLVNGNFWVNNHAHILKGKNGWHDYTLYVALKQLNVDKAVTGAVQPKINQANLLSLEIPNLSNNNLQTINTELDVVFHKVFHLRAENKSLQELKGLYLKKFFE